MFEARKNGFTDFNLALDCQIFEIKVLFSIEFGVGTV